MAGFGDKVLKLRVPQKQVISATSNYAYDVFEKNCADQS
jgi:hypothetical protein